MPFPRPIRRLLRLLGWLFLASVCAFLASVAYVQVWFAGNASFPADCAIVFGTAVRPTFDRHGQIIYTGPGPGILRRVSTAADLYRMEKVSKVFVTGGRGEGMAESEGSVMQRIAVVKGVALADIVVEGESRSTWENLRNTLPLMKDCKSIIGVSDRYHLGRIRLWSILAGRPIMVYPATQTANAAFELRSVIREALGVMVTPGVWWL